MDMADGDYPVRLLLIALLLFLVGPAHAEAYPGPIFPGRPMGGGGGSGGGEGGEGTSLSLVVVLDDTDAEAPFQPVVTAQVYGYFGTEIFHYTCFTGDEEKETPPTFGTEVDDHTDYLLDKVCGPYVEADDYEITVWIERLGVIAAEDDETVTIVEPEGQIAIAIAYANEDPCTLPCSSQTVDGLAFNYDTPVAWKADADDSCATSTTDCTDPCWETALGATPGISTAALPDFTGSGVKTLRMCVTDDVPSSDYTTVTFRADSATADLDCAATSDPTASASSPLNNVALEVDCSGGTSASGCDVTFDCDIAAAGGSTTLMTNNFDTTGAQGCDDATSSTGTTSCAGGVATAGTGAGTTNALFFHNQYTSAAEQYITLDDFIVVTDSSNTNQNRFNLRDDATNKYILQTASPSTNSLRLTCPGNSCTTAASQYVDGSPFDIVLHVINTATGLAALETTGGTNLCTCTGNAAGDVDGFVLNGGQAVVSISGVTVTTPGAASDPTPLTANTTWPYNTQDEATENCDGYTTGTSTARVTVDCPDSEVQILDVPVQVTAAPTFSIDSVTPNITSATFPDCLVDELTITYSGTAINTVSAIGATMFTGATAETLTTTTDAASPFAFAATGGWQGYAYDAPGSYTITATATREGVVATRQTTFQCLEPATSVTDLVMGPLAISRTVTPGATATADTITVTDALDGTIPFSCIESPPVDWVSISSCCADTPATLTATYATSTLAQGTYDTNFVCTNDDTPTDTATTSVRVVVTAPQAGDPTWSAGRDGSGNLLVYTGKIGQSATEAIPSSFDNRPGTSAARFGNWDDVPSTATQSHVLRNSRLSGGITTSGNKDIVQINWATDRLSKWWLLKSLDLYGAIFNTTGPHGDTLQTFCATNAGATCQDFTTRGIYAQNVYALSSDSGQLWWNTGHKNVGANTFDFFIIHDSFFGTTPASVSSCETRRAAACGGASCTYNCGGKRFNMPINNSGPDLTDMWIINNAGDTHFEGGTSANPNTNKLIMIPPTGQTCASVSSVPYDVAAFVAVGGRRRCYNTINAALAAGETERPFMRLACGGWANPSTDAPGCISGYGYVPSN